MYAYATLVERLELPCFFEKLLGVFSFAEEPDNPLFPLLGAPLQGISRSR